MVIAPGITDTVIASCSDASFGSVTVMTNDRAAVEKSVPYRTRAVPDSGTITLHAVSSRPALSFTQRMPC